MDSRGISVHARMHASEALRTHQQREREGERASEREREAQREGERDRVTRERGWQARAAQASQGLQVFSLKAVGGSVASSRILVRCCGKLVST